MSDEKMDRDYADALLHILDVQKRVIESANHCDFIPMVKLLQEMTDTIFAYPSIKRTTEIIWDDTMKEVGQGLIHCSCRCERGQGIGPHSTIPGQALDWYKE